MGRRSQTSGDRPPGGSRDAAAVERHLRGLDAEACAALVADLWAARGFETRREGDTVVATRRDESRVLYVPPQTRLRRPGPPDARRIDAVVDPRGRRRSRRLADARDAQLVDAAALREVLWYGVDRATAAAVCERHLGDAPAALSPSLGRRLRTAVDGTGATVGVVLVAALAVLVAGVTVAPGLDGGSEDGAVAGDDGDPALGAATASRPSGPSTVPGLDEDGVDDLTALAAAHRRAVRGVSYTLWMDYRGPRAGDPATRVHRDVDVAVEGREYVAATRVDGTNRTVSETVYHDRTGWYAARAVDGNVTYRRVGAGDGGPYGVPNPDETARSLVRRYLSTPETRVTTVERRGQDLYRVVGRGTPSGLGARPIGNYTVTALVTPEGFVVDVTATYALTVGDGDRRARVQREWTYGRVGETTVDPPAWYDEAFADPDAGDD